MSTKPVSVAATSAFSSNLWLTVPAIKKVKIHHIFSFLSEGDLIGRMAFVSRENWQLVEES